MQNHYTPYKRNSNSSNLLQEREQSGRFVRNFWLHSSGAAAIEYAILLALVIGVVVTAGHLLGGVTNDALNQVFAKAAVTSGMPPSKPNSTGDRDSSENAPPEVDQAAHATRFQLLTTQFIAIVSLGGLLIVLRRARKRRELLGDDTEVPKTVRQLAVQNRLFKKRQLIYKLLAQDQSAILASQMEVRHVMSEKLTIVSPSDLTVDLRTIMQKNKLRHLLVCDAAGTLVGIISDRDICRSCDGTAADIMTANPVTVTTNTPISPAVTQMIDLRISCLPVLNESGQLVAVLTSTDLMMALQCSLQILHKLASELGQDDASNAESRESDSSTIPAVPSAVPPAAAIPIAELPSDASEQTPFTNA